MQLCVHLALLCALAYSVEAAVESIQLKQRSYTRSFAPEDTQLAKREDIVLDGFEKGLAFYGTVGVGVREFSLRQCSVAECSSADADAAANDRGTL